MQSIEELDELVTKVAFNTNVEEKLQKDFIAIMNKEYKGSMGLEMSLKWKMDVIRLTLIELYEKEYDTEIESID